MDFYELLEAADLKSALGPFRYKLIYIRFINDRPAVEGPAELVTSVEDCIFQKYFIAFKILCEKDVVAVAIWHDDIILVGVIADELHDGRYVWIPAQNISWPGETTTLENLE